MSENEGKGLSLHTKILLGLILGAVCGLAANQFGPSLEQTAGWPVVKRLNEYVMTPIGTIFLNLLLMTVVPLVFASLAVGVARFGDLGRLGRIGAKTFAFFIGSMTTAVFIGLVLVNVARPGDVITEETRDRMLAEYKGKVAGVEAKAEDFGVDKFVSIVPRNPISSATDEKQMLSVIFFALLVGAGLTRIPRDQAHLVVQLLEAIGELMVFIIGLAMKLAPFGVFAFLFRATSTLGLDILWSLGMYVVVVLVGLALQMFVVFPLAIRILCRRSPVEFFRKIRAVIVTAFSTSSSNATLPTSIKVTQEELGVPPQIAGFVLPLGATMNMNGTALFEGVTVVFLAQVTGISLDLGQQIVVIVLSVLSAIGAAGVPGGSIPLMMLILATVGVKPENIALVLGVDRILDMCRTTLNVVGDIIAAAYVARTESLGSPVTEPVEQQST